MILKSISKHVLAEPTTWAWFCADIYRQGGANCSKKRKFVPYYVCAQIPRLTVSVPFDSNRKWTEQGWILVSLVCMQRHILGKSGKKYSFLIFQNNADGSILYWDSRLIISKTKMRGYPHAVFFLDPNSPCYDLLFPHGHILAKRSQYFWALSLKQSFPVLGRTRNNFFTMNQNTKIYPATTKTEMLLKVTFSSYSSAKLWNFAKKINKSIIQSIIR